MPTSEEIQQGLLRFFTEQTQPERDRRKRRRHGDIATSLEQQARTGVISEKEFAAMSARALSDLPRARPQQINEVSRILPGQGIDVLDLPGSELDTADVDSGADAATRAGVSIKGSEKGVANFLLGKFGPNNVRFRASDGKFFFREKEGDEFTQVVPDEISLLDPQAVARGLAGNTRPIIEAGIGIGGSLAGGAAGTALAGPVGSTVGAFTGGAIADAVSGEAVDALGNRFAPGEDSLSAEDRIGRAALSVGLGAFGEGAARVGGRVFQGATKRGRAASQIADEFRERTSSDIAGEAVERKLREADFLEETLGTGIKENVAFSAAQRLESRTAALSERIVAQTPSTMGGVIARESKKLRQIKALQDATVRRIAANPDKLDTIQVAQAAAKTLLKRRENLIEARREMMGDVFKNVKRLGEGTKFASVNEAASASADILQEMGQTPDDALLEPLRLYMKKVQEFSSPDGLVDIGFIQRNLSFWSRETMPKGKSTFADMADSQRQRLAVKMHSALFRDLEAAGGVARLGQSAEVLQGAIKRYKDMSLPIDGEVPLMARNLMDAEAKGTTEAVLETMMNGAIKSPNHFGNVMRLIEKTDPGVAADMKAKVVQRLFLKAGNFAPSVMAFGQHGEVLPKTKTLLNLLENHDKVFESIFKKDPETLNRLIFIGKFARRLSTGPRIAGSDSVPKLMASLRMLNIGSALVAGPAGAITRLMLPGIERKLFSMRGLSIALTQRDGIRHMESLLRARLAGNKGKYARSFMKLLGVVTRERAIGRPEGE